MNADHSEIEESTGASDWKNRVRRVDFRLKQLGIELEKLSEILVQTVNMVRELLQLHDKPEQRKKLYRKRRHRYCEVNASSSSGEGAERAHYTVYRDQHPPMQEPQSPIIYTGPMKRRRMSSSSN